MTILIFIVAYVATFFISRWLFVKGTDVSRRSATNMLLITLIPGYNILIAVITVIYDMVGEWDNSKFEQSRFWKWFSKK